MPEKKTIEKLYKKFLSNEISKEELEQFLKVLDSENGDIIVSKMMDGTWEQMYAVRKTTLIPVVKWRIFRAVAAALILLVAGAGGFWLFNPTGNKEVVINRVAPPTSGIVPGGNKAILTLADGSTMLLDTVGNGLLAAQGNVQVIKLNDGQLAYQGVGGGELIHNTIRTPKGGQYQLVLADGTKVWLNSESELSFPAAFAGHDRKVAIKGEAYFEVTKDEAKPFKVSVNGAEVQVLGTQFNISAYNDDPTMKTTLLGGSVKIVKGQSSKVIRPGEQAQVTNKDGALNPKITVNAVDVDVVTAWKNGRFIFHEDNIQSVMRQLARWYNVNVAFEGNVTSEKFVGVISRSRYENISDILSMLEKTGTVRFVINGNNVTVMPYKD